MSTDVTRHLLLDELHELYDIENQMARALPRMAEMATLPRLKTALAEQLIETRTQVQRLGRVLADLGQTVRKRTTQTLTRLIDEGGKVLFESDGSEAINRELMRLLRYIENYEITACGCAIAYAEMLGYTDVARVLRATLEEKEAAEAQLVRADNRHAGAYLVPQRFSQN